MQIKNLHLRTSNVVVVLPDPFREMGRGGSPRRPNNRATPQGLDLRSKIEAVVPKMVRRRGSVVEHSRRNNPTAGVHCSQALQEEFFRFIMHR